MIASIANGYYSLLMLDGQLEISRATLEVWKEQIRVMESKFKVGEETENAVSQARASLHELEATHNDLLRQQREAENALCTLLGTTARSIERGSLEQQTFPERINAGLPVRLLSKRPDVVQAEMVRLLYAQSGTFGFLSESHAVRERRLDQLSGTSGEQSRRLDTFGCSIPGTTHLQPGEAHIQPACVQG